MQTRHTLEERETSSQSGWSVWHVCQPRSFIWPDAQGPYCQWQFSSVQTFAWEWGGDSEMSDFQLSVGMLWLLVYKSVSSLSSICLPSSCSINVFALQSWAFWPQFPWLTSRVHASLMSSKFTDINTSWFLSLLCIHIVHCASHYLRSFVKGAFLNEGKGNRSCKERTFFPDSKVRQFRETEQLQDIGNREVRAWEKTSVIINSEAHIWDA